MTSENGHSIREDPSLKIASSGLKTSRMKQKRVLLNLVVSARPLRQLVRFMVHYSSSVCRLSYVGRQDVFVPLALPPPLTQVFPPPTQFFHLPLLKPSSKKAPTRLGSPTRSILLNRWKGELPRTRRHWRVRCCVEGACDGVTLVGDTFSTFMTFNDLCLTGTDEELNN